MSDDFLVVAQGGAIPASALLTGFGTILLAMAAAVTALWKVIHTNMQTAEKRFAACESEHKIKDAWQLEVSLELGELKGRLTGHEEARSDIRELTGGVMQKLDRIDECMTTVAHQLSEDQDGST
jgi:hypothetical protein